MPRTKPTLCQTCAGFSCKPATSGFVPAWFQNDIEKIKFAMMLEAAGESEVLKGMPLCGSTWNVFNERILVPREIERKDIIIDNLIRCRPHNNEFPFIATAEKMIETCRQWDSVIDLYNPNAIILALHPTSALIYTNQGYSTANAVNKALTLLSKGYRPLIAMGKHMKEAFFPQLPGSITDWDGKHFFVDWIKRGMTFEEHEKKREERVKTSQLSLKELLRK